MMRAQHTATPETVTVLARRVFEHAWLRLSALGLGGTVVLIAKFDAAAYLVLASVRVTHTLGAVQFSASWRAGVRPQ